MLLLLSIAGRAEAVLGSKLLRTVVCSRVVEFVIGPVITAVVVVLVEECDNIDNGLRVLLLLLLGDSIGLQRFLPFLR